VDEAALGPGTHENRIAMAIYRIGVSFEWQRGGHRIPIGLAQVQSQFVRFQAIVTLNFDSFTRHLDEAIKQFSCRD
jgi:hypothetical protein